MKNVFLFSSLASLLFHATLIFGIQYFGFTAAQVHVKPGDVSRKFAIDITFSEQQPTSELQDEPPIEDNPLTEKTPPSIAEEINRNELPTEVEDDNEETVVLLPDEGPVTKGVSRSDSNLKPVAGHMTVQIPPDHSRINQDEVITQVERRQDIANSTPAENGVRSEAESVLIKNLPPPYPTLARKRAYTGKVTLRLEDGKCGGIEIVNSSGHTILDKSAISAVREWEFAPARRWGKAVTAFTEITINFKLE